MNLLSVFGQIAFAYFMMYAIYSIGTGFYSKWLIKRKNTTEELPTEDKYSVSILVPALNEEEVIIDSLKNLLNLEYNNYEVVVVNDGSTDNTLQTIIDYFRLIKTTPTTLKIRTGDILPTEDVIQYYRSQNGKLIVIDKKNGGKADAFNAGLNIINSDYVVTVDADTVLTKDAIRKLLQPIYRNEAIVAVGAQVGVANNLTLEKKGNINTFELSNNYFNGVQALEYLKTFLIYRTGHHALNASLLISGACGLFKTHLLFDLRGFDTNSVCEDIEITMRIQEYTRAENTDMLVEFVPEPIAWTQVPTTYGNLSKQRNRWFRGMAQTLWKYKNMMLNPHMGAVGFFSFPAYFLFGYLAPFMKALVLAKMAITGIDYTLLVQGVLVEAMVAYLAISSVKFTNSPLQSRKDKLKLAWYSAVELVWMQFFYMFVQIKGGFQALTGNKSWNKFNRISFNKAT